MIVVERRILDFFNRGFFFFFFFLFSFFVFIYLLRFCLCMGGNYGFLVVDKTIYSQWVLMAVYH